MARVSDGTLSDNAYSLATRQKSAINAACLFVWFKSVCESQTDPPPHTHTQHRIQVSEWVEPAGVSSKQRRRQRRAALLHRAAAQQRLGAKACGFTGMVLLQGAFDASSKDTNGGADWDGSLLANFHPTYYGMAVARFDRPPAPRSHLDASTDRKGAQSGAAGQKFELIKT